MYLIRYFIMFLLFASALTKLTGAIELVELSSAFLAEQRGNSYRAKACSKLTEYMSVQLFQIGQ